jgi:hypothetical protein
VSVDADRVEVEVPWPGTPSAASEPGVLDGVDTSEVTR